jgi:hypothetical protein
MITFLNLPKSGSGMITFPDPPYTYNRSLQVSPELATTDNNQPIFHELSPLKVDPLRVQQYRFYKKKDYRY